VSTLLTMLCCCVSCTQLTDDTTRAMAGAAQRFLSSCRGGILRANDRSDDEAIASAISVHNATALDVFRASAIQTLNMVNCPLCLADRPGMQRECCDNGQCANSTCQCNAGKLPWHHRFTSSKKNSNFTVS